MCGVLFLPTFVVSLPDSAELLIGFSIVFVSVDLFIGSRAWLPLSVCFAYVPLLILIYFSGYGVRFAFLIVGPSRRTSRVTEDTVRGVSGPEMPPPPACHTDM